MLEHQALSLADCQKIATEMLEGEAILAESERTRKRLRTLLAFADASAPGMRSAAAAGSWPISATPRPPTTRVGERTPTRDPVGVAGPHGEGAHPMTDVPICFEVAGPGVRGPATAEPSLPPAAHRHWHAGGGKFEQLPQSPCPGALRHGHHINGPRTAAPCRHAGTNPGSTRPFTPPHGGRTWAGASIWRARSTAWGGSLPRGCRDSKPSQGAVACAS